MSNMIHSIKMVSMKILILLKSLENRKNIYQIPEMGKQYLRQGF